MDAHTPVLLYLAEKGALYRPFQSSTAKMGNDLKISQQSVSRKLREMEGEGLLHRTATPQGIRVTISEKGRQFLRHTYIRLKEVFGARLVLKGTLVTGLGEGRYYMSLGGYRKQFQSKLGFTPYEGTLNLHVDAAERTHLLQGLEMVHIDGFDTKSRTFGGIQCYLASINGIKGAVMIPERTGHDAHVLECIAPIHLRSRLRLKDGDLITITGD